MKRAKCAPRGGAWLSCGALWSLLGLVVACGGPRERPALPAPEYERPVQAPWAPTQPNAWGDEDEFDEVGDEEDDPAKPPSAPGGDDDAGAAPGGDAEAP